MKKSVVETTDLPWAGGAYSLAIRCGPFIFTGGMGPFDAAGQLIGANVEEQTRQVMQNLEALLAMCGQTWDAVIKCTVHLADMAHDFRGFDAVYREYVRPPYPVRTTVGSRTKGDIRVEIDVVARISDEEGSGSSGESLSYIVRDRPVRPPA